MAIRPSLKDLRPPAAVLRILDPRPNHRGSVMDADYVIVGAGSAGCAIAYRLAEAGRQVLVIEHGGTDAGPFIQMPAALSYPMNMARYDWGFQTEPEPYLGGRVLATPRGKVLGGSSSINGMVYVRGHARDFDHWAEVGAAGWAHADVLPYFKRMEHWHGGNKSGDPGGDPAWRGHDGPLHVTRGPRTNPLTRAFVTAGQQPLRPQQPFADQIPVFIQADWLDRGHLDIHFQMVLQVLPDARAIGDHRNAMFGQMRRRSNARQHQQFGRVERRGREYHLGPGANHLDLATPLHLDANSPAITDDNAPGHGADHAAIGAFQRRAQIGIGG